MLNKFVQYIVAGTVFTMTMYPASGSAYVSGNKPMARYSEMRDYFNRSAAGLQKELNKKYNNFSHFTNAAFTIVDYDQYTLPPGIPRNVYAVDYADSEYQVISDLFYNIDSLKEIDQEISNITYELDEKDFFHAIDKMRDIYKYLDDNGKSSVIDGLTAVDRGIDKCVDYSKNMPNMITSKIPSPAEALEVSGLKNYWHTGDPTMFNEITAIDNHIRQFGNSMFDNFEGNAQKAIDKATAIKSKLDVWYGNANKDNPVQGYQSVYNALNNFLDNVIKVSTEGIELWKSRNDVSTIHGQIISGKTAYPNGHIKPTLNNGRATYRSTYLKALAECKNAFNQGRSEAQRVDKLKGVAIDLMK